MAGKMSPKFVALCSLAVGAIYSTGYAITSNSSALAATSAQQSHAAAPPSSIANSSSGSKKSSGTHSSSKSKHSDGSSKGNSDSSGTSGSSTQTQSQTTSSSATSKTQSTSKKTNTTQKYIDGTYHGSAANRIGSVAVAVTVKSGKIANVQITACDTHYPQSYIDPVLPNYVVSHQTTRIPAVSGATLSSADFYYATVQALSQAQNPNYKG